MEPPENEVESLDDSDREDHQLLEEGITPTGPGPFEGVEEFLDMFGDD